MAEVFLGTNQKTMALEEGNVKAQRQLEN